MLYSLTDFNRCCSEDESRLAYPRFSAVFLQTFCIHDSLKFVLPEEAFMPKDEYERYMANIRDEAQLHAKEACKRKGKKVVDEGWIFKSIADYRNKPIIYMYQDIEKQIFITSQDDKLEQRVLKHNNKKFGSKKTIIPFNKTAPKQDLVRVFSNSSVYRFSLRGFDFSVPIDSEKDDKGNYKHEPVLLTGHANVELSLFYGNTASIAYKFFFDGYTASILTKDGDAETHALTDHLITFLSCHLGAEYWSAKSKEESSIDLLKKFQVDRIWFDEDGNYSDSAMSMPSPEDGEKRVFNNVMIRYKKYLYEYCTAYKEKCTVKEKAEHVRFREENPLSVSFDHHYAMVDIWGDVSHSIKESDRNVFDENDAFKLSEADIITHIREYHKPEMIGLMTLYPSEWPYRDGGTFDYVCGESVAIDTDDLVLVGTHVAAVVGTYDRRGEESCGNNWKAMAKVKAKYQVAWPEYLMILQFILAKKVVISRMKDRIIDITNKIADKSTDKLIFATAHFILDLTRQILQLDVVKYAKFASHRVMYDRTMERLKVDKDIDEIHDMSEMLNSNLQNISDYKTMKSDSVLNWILGLISVVSISELLYQDSKLEFGSTLFYKTEETCGRTEKTAAAIIFATAFIGIVAVGWLIGNAIFKWIKERK